MATTATANNNNTTTFMLKILILGNSGVGKSNLLLKLTDNVFSPHHISTIGVDFKFHELDVHGKQVKLQIWDTAGQERFGSIVRSFYRNTHGALLVFDLTSRASFEEIESRWLADLAANAKGAIKLILVGNKADLTRDREVSSSEAEAWAADHGMTYIETSAKAGTAIEDAFSTLASELIDSNAAAYVVKPKVLQPTTKVSKQDSCCTLM